MTKRSMAFSISGYSTRKRPVKAASVLDSDKPKRPVKKPRPTFLEAAEAAEKRYKGTMRILA